MIGSVVCCANGLSSLALACLLVSRPAVAQVTRSQCVELVGDAPEALRGCVTAERLCESYQRAVVSNGFEDADVAAIRWQVRLRARLGTADIALDLDAFAAGRLLGRRSLAIRPGDCAAVPDALALVLVLMAREAAAREPPPSAAEEAFLPPPPAAAANPRDPPGASRGDGSVEIGAGAALVFGALPSAAFGLQLQAATLGQPIAFRVRAALLWPQEVGIEEGFVAMQDYELAVEACAGFRFAHRPRLALHLCAGPSVGWLYARARRFTLRNERATELLVYFGMIPEVSVELGVATWLRIGAGGAIAIERPRFDVGFDSGRRPSELSAPRWLRAEFGLTLLQIF